MISSNEDTLASGIAGAPSYPFLFKTFDEDDVAVKVRLLSSGVETVLDIGDDYTLTGVGNTGGDVVLATDAPVQDWMDGGNLKAGYVIYISFKPNIHQLTKFRDLGRHAPRRIEDALDRVTMFTKSFFQGIGDVARSIKLPTNVHPSEFNPTLPSDFNSSADQLLAVNPTLNGWAMFDGSVIQEITDFLAVSYTPSAIQSLGLSGQVAVSQYRRQHVRIKSTGGAQPLDNTPFGTTEANFRDGMEIVVESTSDADYMTLSEDIGVDYSYVGNGGIEFKKGTVVSFIYNATEKRFYVKSLGAW